MHRILLTLSFLFVCIGCQNIQPDWKPDKDLPHLSSGTVSTAQGYYSDYDLTIWISSDGKPSIGGNEITKTFLQSLFKSKRARTGDASILIRPHRDCHIQEVLQTLSWIGEPELKHIFFAGKDQSMEKVLRATIVFGHLSDTNQPHERTRIILTNSRNGQTTNLEYDTNWSMTQLYKTTDQMNGTGDH
jgi:biopolymer transport protein ExbD